MPQFEGVCRPGIEGIVVRDSGLLRRFFSPGKFFGSFDALGLIENARFKRCVLKTVAFQGPL